MKINADLSKRAEVHTPDMEWVPSPEPGVDIKPLHEFGDEKVMLMRILAGTRIARHRHEAGTELFVLEGTLADENGTYPKGAWLRQPAGSVHEPFSEEGCIYYVKKGHFV